MSTVKPFYNQNGYTEFNNYILDHIMPELTPCTWKVLCFIMRKTKGWQKKQDDISLSQIMDGTRIKSKTTVITSIKDLEDRQYILADRSTDNISCNTYTLNVDLEINLGSTINELPRQSSSTINGLPGSSKNGQGVVQKMDTQKKDLNKEVKEKKNGRPPAVDTYRKIANRFPDKATWPMLERVTDLEFWEQVVINYIACGWNKVNIKTMLEFYDRRELPKVNGNGRKSNYQMANQAEVDSETQKRGQQLAAAFEKRKK